MDILVYEDIGYLDWDGNGLTAETFNQELMSVPSNEKELNIRINSVGGLVGDGIAIYNSVKRLSRTRAAMGNPITINSYIEGFAYSSAATIAMSGDKIFMGKGTTLMIHNAASFVWGDCRAMRKEADLLEKYNGQIAGFYASKANKKPEPILSLMDDETYFTPEEAIAIGLCDAMDDKIITNMALYQDDLESLTKLATNHQYFNWMSSRIRNRTQPKRDRVDKKKSTDYTGPRKVNLLSLELDLLEQEAM